MFLLTSNIIGSLQLIKKANEITEVNEIPVHVMGIDTHQTLVYQVVQHGMYVLPLPLL